MEPTAFTTLFNEIIAPARAKQAQEEKEIYLPEYSRFKLQFVYRNGSTSVPYWSYDIQPVANKQFLTNEDTGLGKLMKLVSKKKDMYVVATIWANLTPDLRPLIDGRLNRNYDYQVFKHVRNDNSAYYNKALRFVPGFPPYPHSQQGKIVDVDTLFRSYARNK
jgi:hypothetical protein